MIRFWLFHSIQVITAVTKYWAISNLSGSRNLFRTISAYSSASGL